MDELFSNLAIQTVQLVGKAAFGAAGTLALRRVAEYANRVPRTSGRQPEVERLRALFEAKLRIVTPAIDLVDIIAARGHSTMASVLQLTYALRADILAFSDKLARLDGMHGEQGTVDALPQKSDKSLVSLFRRAGGAADTKSDAAAALNESIVDDLKALLAAIDDAVPLLNLALTTSGVHLGSSLPTEVSPGRLLQASALLSRSAAWFDIKSGATQGAPGRAPDVLVGEPFTLRLYSLFAGSVRPKSKHDFTWKEEFARCHAGLWRVAPDVSAHEAPLYADYCYELRIVEDLNDGRYHDDTPAGGDGAVLGMQPKWVADMAQKLTAGSMRPGCVVRIGLRSISSLHYTSAGSLLNIEDSNSPVLVISVDHGQDGSEAAACEASLKLSASSSTLSPEASVAKWYAMEIADDELGESDEESE
ncbi:Ran-specific GTPase-activating protein 30, partial [Coemansia biformis]